MKRSSLLGHTQELLASILASDSNSARTLPADGLIDKFFRARKYLGSHDRRFIAETTYGTLRHFRRARLVADTVLTGRNLQAGKDDGLVLTIIAYLMHCTGGQRVEGSDIVEKLHSHILKQEIDGLLDAMHRFRLPVDGSHRERIATEHSFPDWMVDHFVDQFGLGETERLCVVLNEQAPLTLRVNTLKTTVEECRSRLRSEGVNTRPTALSPLGLVVPKRINIFGLSSFRDGLFEVQDEGSQLLPLLVDPKPTTKVLDACAGAGGKTLAFAAIMRNRGEVFATDVNDRRLEELRRRIRRAGVSNVRVREVSGVDELEEDFKDYFDVVFVDAPCSGLGTIRRNPGMKWTVSEAMVKELSAKQTRLLETSAPLVKQGGRLVYATCTLLREENEEVVLRFLSKYPEFTLLDPAEHAAKLHIPDAVSDRFIKLLPHRHGTDGFFCAMLQKVSSK